MSAPLLSQRARAVVAAVITAYDVGGSYNSVARELRLEPGTVRGIMHKHAPDSIRTNNEQPTPKRTEEGLTLATLGLHRVGPCADCGCEMVSGNREKGQTCGLCVAARAA